MMFYSFRMVQFSTEHSLLKDDISHADIYNKIHYEASRMYDTTNYYLVLHVLDIVISCNPTKCYKSDQVQKKQA